MGGSRKFSRVIGPANPALEGEMGAPNTGFPERVANFNFIVRLHILDEGAMQQQCDNLSRVLQTNGNTVPLRKDTNLTKDEASAANFANKQRWKNHANMLSAAIRQELETIVGWSWADSASVGKATFKKPSARILKKPSKHG